MYDFCDDETDYFSTKPEAYDQRYMFWEQFRTIWNATIMNFVLAVVGVLTSVISAFYYLRIVKVMYFDEAEEAFDRPGRELGVVVGVSALVVLLFFAMLDPVVNGAAAAATAFFPG